MKKHTPQSSTQTPNLEIVNEVNSFDELNLEKELLTQFNTARQLLAEARHDDDTPLNQKIQNINTIVSILNNIASLQEKVHNLSRMKTLEHTLIETLKAFPTISEAFIDAYKANLEKAKE